MAKGMSVLALGTDSERTTGVDGLVGTVRTTAEAHIPHSFPLSLYPLVQPELLNSSLMKPPMDLL